MGLINDSVQTVGLGSLTTRSTKKPATFGPDFPEGFKIIEYIDGKPSDDSTITLAGPFMPFQPLTFGGKQQISKEYYAGNPEPTTQILGSRENDITIKGRLKLKNIGDESLREAAIEYQKAIDAMRIRGNLVRIKLRDWFRYGFIEEASFDLKQKTDIDYSITFSIVGQTEPKNSMFLSGADENPSNPNRQLISQAATLLAASQNYPTSMPQTISDLLNSYISDVADGINLVTGFVDGILDDAEKLNASANRALGLIKNVRATISSTNRRIGQISMAAASLGANFATEAQKTAATISNANHIHKVQTNNINLLFLLIDLQAKFRNMVQAVPYRRHLTRQGDTLQKISMLYYNTADRWIEILTHNKLSTTNLTNGQILEIPR